MENKDWKAEIEQDKVEYGQYVASVDPYKKEGEYTLADIKIYKKHEDGSIEYITDKYSSIEEIRDDIMGAKAVYDKVAFMDRIIEKLQKTIASGCYIKCNPME